MAGKSIIVMGVCGSGKSSVGLKVAQALGAKFIDGDDLHPRANIQKMAGGNPLNDEDRAPWLERIRDAAYSLEQKNEVGVIVCSALKKQYRDQIRDGNDSVHFLFLDGDQPLILERMRARKGHFMRESMVQSQFDTLERPDGEAGVFHIDIDGTFEQVVDRAVSALEQAV
ncbi:gluconokinase [Aeromonas salmonicida]|uniref:gluconokinase n=1 Tax=Aeromonas salmonicida TaxID=645 RepID=UPI000C1C47C9|nr:gluconokinase [Aeromonas salmonicida]ATU96190.1 gluconate kinase [Aeromonas salmonicida]HDN9022159.1 gluconokinase [Aeromonas salmonicida]HEH9395810.1 gluconokinase [Aeromonas salmonicida]